MSTKTGQFQSGALVFAPHRVSLPDHLILRIEKLCALTLRVVHSEIKTERISILLPNEELVPLTIRAYDLRTLIPRRVVSLPAFLRRKGPRGVSATRACYAKPRDNFARMRICCRCLLARRRHVHTIMMPLEQCNDFT